jgi:uncharacterized protein (TIGR02466 family)
MKDFSNADFNVLPIFSKPIFIKNILLTEKENNIILNEIKKQSFINSGNINNEKNLTQKISVVGTNMKFLELKKLLFLKNKILNVFEIFKNKVMEYNLTEFKITTSWLTKTSKDHSCNFHSHSNCMFSGVFYFNVNEKSGNISFENFNKSSFLVIPEKYNIYNSSEISISPKKNDLIIFPSCMNHRIEKNLTDIDRYSIAFNLLPIGVIGVDDSNINLNFSI